MKRLACAIYTRKSSEEGLDQAFNSLDAQYEACAAYIASQKGEGWFLVPERYDDGGISGGTLERPAMQRLLADIDAGRVQQIVVYKIDRLTRSLSDFAKIVDRLEARDASFVSVTQSFNTATSMGRLTLNMLLSFAQFEREVTAERIRDKIAASKRKGLWTGGSVPLGYLARDRGLVIDPDSSTLVRAIFDQYETLGALNALKGHADEQGWRTRSKRRTDGAPTGGKPFTTGHLHHILSNPIYAGRVRHKGKVFDGQHEALIEPARWDRIQDQLQASAMRRRGAMYHSAPLSPLIGKLFDETGDRLTPSHTRSRQGARRRYYVSSRLIRRTTNVAPGGWRLPAEPLEQTIDTVLNTALKVVFKTVSGEIPIEAIKTARAELGAFLKTNLAQRCLVIERATIAPGQLSVTLSRDSVAKALNWPPDAIDAKTLRVDALFRLRKRGVETKVLLRDHETNRSDPVLLRNIANSQAWLEKIEQGQSFEQIAAAEGTSARRIRQLLHLAFLAPDILRTVIQGQQPVGLTTESLKDRDLPLDWNAQRAFVKSL